MLAILSSPVCPLQEEVLRQPSLARILAFVRTQYRVRDINMNVVQDLCVWAQVMSWQRVRTNL